MHRLRGAQDVDVIGRERRAFAGPIVAGHGHSLPLRLTRTSARLAIGPFMPQSLGTAKASN